VAGGSLHGSVTGAGEPVVLLHGGPGLTDYTSGLAQELSGAYRVYRYQQRGNAPSPTVGPYDVATHMGDFIAVLDHLKLDQVWLVGHSWGGHLVMYLAVSHPGRIRGVLSIDPLGAVGDGGEEDLGTATRSRMLPGAVRQLEELDRRARAGHGSADDATEGLHLVWPGYFADPASAPPMPDIHIGVDCYAQTFASIRSHLADGTLQRALPSITLPFAFLLGAESPIPPVHGQRSAELIPGATVHVLADCGHFLWMEKPGETLKALDRLTAP
jgi:pimeloyl-ACP methyl ester carboxylesterase